MSYKLFFFNLLCLDCDIKVLEQHMFANYLHIMTSSNGNMNSPQKGQWRGALMFSLICVWINDLVNNREAGDLRRYRAHNDVIVIITAFFANRD